jgi:hypothetical protein
MDLGGGTAHNAETHLYWLISQMKQDITIVIGTIMGGGVELPEDIINRYSAILRANIDFNKHLLPQQMLELLNEILALPQVAELEPRRFNRVKGIRNRFYVNYTLRLNSLTQNEGRAVNQSSHFSLEPTFAEPVTNGQNAFGRVWNSQFRMLHPVPSRIIEPVVFNPTYGPLIAKKLKRGRKTKSANHKSGSNTRRKRSAP